MHFVDLDEALSHIDGELQPVDSLPVYSDVDRICQVLMVFQVKSRL